VNAEHSDSEGSGGFRIVATENAFELQYRGVPVAMIWLPTEGYPHQEIEVLHPGEYVDGVAVGNFSPPWSSAASTTVDLTPHVAAIDAALSEGAQP